MPATASTVRPALDATLDVETPEQVIVSYTLAGIGTRGAAALIDLVLMLLLTGTLWYSAASLPRLLPSMRDMGRGGWVNAVIIIGQFLILWGYFVTFEALWDGQTPGKRLLGLRVVRNGGGGVDIGTSAARNLIRFIDFLPFGYFVGMISIIANQRNQRLGDLVAGTIVVRERLLRHERARAAASPVEDDGVAIVATLDDERFALLDRFVTREATLDDASRARIAAALVARVGVDVRTDAVAALRILHQRELLARRSLRPTTSATGTRREEWAVVAEGRPRWEAFAADLSHARRQGLDSLTEDEVTAFVEAYREVATDLARLRTADRGRGGEEVFTLSRLVSAGHNLLYRRPSQGIERIGRFIAFDIPREVRRSWRHVAVAAALLFVPAAATIVAIVRTPSLAQRMLPPGMIERAEQGLERGNTGADYLPNGEDEKGSVLSAFLMTNNIRVALVAFAGGITAGVLTVYALVFNGIAALGAGVGLYITKGIGGQILGFVAAHGVLELSAICLAGAAGLLLATAMLVPGDRTRREALTANGARSLHLVACVVIFLILAGIIEGNISPSKLPDSAKFATAVITAIGMVWYLSLGREPHGTGAAAGEATTRRGP
ncbi:MAG: stage II sporulation protein M [Gemmatimonadaceae bacterium]|nr:stage II sporulation protein M [Gemmatimonadaceae bacterium]